MTLLTRHSQAGAARSADRASPITKKTAAERGEGEGGGSKWIFPWGQFAKQRPLWCQHCYQVEPCRVGSEKLHRMSHVFYPRKIQNLGLTWEFSIGFHW